MRPTRLGYDLKLAFFIYRKYLSESDLRQPKKEKTASMRSERGTEVDTRSVNSTISSSSSSGCTDEDSSSTGTPTSPTHTNLKKSNVSPRNVYVIFYSKKHCANARNVLHIIRLTNLFE